MPRLVENPKHWRERAKNMRSLAERTPDPDLQRGLLESAREYERLAERTEGRADPKKAS
jgi:hypothetical protein